MTAPAVARDNRRLIVRVLCQQVLELMADNAREHGEDLIGTLVFTAVWTANTKHLAPRPALRYGELRDVPPDSLREPVTMEGVAEMLCMPRSIVSVYVRELIAKGTIEETPTGLVVPSGVHARMESLERLNATYDAACRLVAALREAGFIFDEAAV